MNKKLISFLILIFLLLFLMYNIISHKYKQYKIAEHTNTISHLNLEIEKSIKNATQIIEYKKSKAYKNKILKKDSGLKNKGEIVVYITTEDKYNKYISKPQIENNTEIIKNNSINSETYNMTIYQKWIWFLFKEDLR